METLSVGAHHTCWCSWSPSMFALCVEMHVCVHVCCCTAVPPFPKRKEKKNRYIWPNGRRKPWCLYFPQKKRGRGGDPTSSKHLKQMAILKQASSIFVDTTSFLTLLLFGIFAIIIHTVGSFEYQINYWTHWSKYLFYNSLLKVKSSWLRLDGVLIYSDI